MKSERRRNRSEARVVWRERWLLLEAEAVLFLCRVVVAIVPFRWVVRLAGRHARPAPAPTPRGVREARYVRWAIRVTAARSRGHATCLPTTLAAMLMLHRRGLTATLHLGVRKREPARLEAHAWLSYGELIVAGEDGHEAFTPVARFS